MPINATVTRRAISGALARDSLDDREGSASPADRAAVLLWSVLLLLALVYAVYFVYRLHDNITALLWYSDYASGFTVAETVGQFGSGGHTVISTTGAYIPLWFGSLTAHLPLHRQLWEITPTLLFVATALVIAWSVARVAGRRVAVYTAVMVLAASPWALAVLMAPVAHNTVYPGTALLGAYIPWLIRRDFRLRRAAVLVPIAALALGTAIASDGLLVVTGVIPAGIAAGAALLQRDRRVRIAGAWALSTLVGAAPIAIITNALMKSDGYFVTAPALSLAPLSSVRTHLHYLYRGLNQLFNGYLQEAQYPGFLHAAVGTACVALLLLSLLGLLYAGVVTGSRLLRRRAQPLLELTRDLHVTYWVGSAVVVMAAFLLTTAAGTGSDLKSHPSYYLSVIFSVAAVIPLIKPPRPALAWAFPAALAVFVVAGIIGLKRDYVTSFRAPIANYARTIVRIADANNATKGYAGYWDASNLTWSTREDVVVRPLLQCANPKGASICPFALMRSPYWYVPARRRTFLLVDPSQQFVTSLPSGLGNPIAIYHLGSISMYVYPYDIASRLGPPPT